MSAYAYSDYSTTNPVPVTECGKSVERTAASPVRSGLYRAAGKRLLDILLVLIAAPVVLLVMLPIVLLVACDGSNPFYTQMRVGRNGRSYRMWKLRSMVPDAEAALETHLKQDAEARAEWDHHQKLKSDPRITRVGRLLRKTSFDELPQLWNVLKGDMSLVGPRPMMLSQQAFYPAQDYYALRPGITGLWQVSARNESAFADRALFDTAYNRRLSLGQDLKLLVATVGVVLKGTGH